MERWTERVIRPSRDKLWDMRPFLERLPNLHSKNTNACQITRLCSWKDWHHLDWNGQIRNTRDCDDWSHSFVFFLWWSLIYCFWLSWKTWKLKTFLTVAFESYSRSPPCLLSKIYRQLRLPSRFFTICVHSLKWLGQCPKIISKYHLERLTLTLRFKFHVTSEM